MPKDRRNDIGTKVLGSILAAIVVGLVLYSLTKSDNAIAKTNEYAKEVAVVKNDLLHIQVAQGTMISEQREVRDDVKTILMKIGGSNERPHG